MARHSIGPKRVRSSAPASRGHRRRSAGTLTGVSGAGAVAAMSAVVFLAGTGPVPSSVAAARDVHRAPAVNAVNAAAAPARFVPGPCPETSEPVEALDDARCGFPEVPENRARPDGRTIRLAVAVIPATAKSAQDPVVFMAGGPGGDAFGDIPFLVEAGLNRERELIMDTIFEACEAEPACKSRCPDLAATLTEQVRKLEAQPLALNAAPPRGGKPVKVVLDGGALVNLLVGNAVPAADVPAALDELARGHPERFARARAAGAHPVIGETAYGLTESVACSEWVPGHAAPRSVRDVTRSDIPTLVMSAGFTPRPGRATDRTSPAR